MEQMRGRKGAGERANTRPVVYEDFQPIADWTHDSDSHFLLVDLPGFMKEELKVEVDNNGRLLIGGERHLSDNKYKRFNQVYSLPPDSDSSKIDAKFDGGVLFLTIPKKEHVIEEEPKHPIAEEQKQETSKTEETSKKEGPKQETTTTEGKPIKDGRDKDVKHDQGNGIHEERKRVDSEARKEMEKGSKFGFAQSAFEMTRATFGFAQSAIEVIVKNKEIVLATILGLAVGMYLSPKPISTAM